MGASVSLQELHRSLIRLNEIHAQHLRVSSYLLDQKSPALPSVSGFQADCVERAEPVVNRDGKNELDVPQSLCLLSQALWLLARQCFSSPRLGP